MEPNTTARTPIDWNKQPLGQMKDADLAELLGVNRLTVFEQRHKRGIAPFRSRPWINWDRASLGMLSDEDVAEILEVPVTLVRAKRRERGIPAFEPRPKIDWRKQPLGLVTDAALAEKLGSTPAGVQMARRKLGIPSLNGNKRKGIDWDSEPLLGKVPDGVLAKKYLCHDATVRDARESRKLPAISMAEWKTRQAA